MRKVLWLLLLLTSIISAKMIHFSEAKYYTSLDKTLHKKGTIAFGKTSMQIVYEDKSTLRYSGDFLIRTKGSKTQKIDLKKKPVMKMFFVLFEAIYFEKKKVLERYFKVKKMQGMVLLSPKEGVARYIDKVQYKKSKKRLEFLEIHLHNKDRIRIEETR